MSEPEEQPPQMATPETKPKRQKTRNRQNEYARQKLAKQEKAAQALAAAGKDGEKEMIYQLAVLATRTANAPTDADRDIDFAYKNSGNPTITPLTAPSLGAWQWYQYARNLPEKFLEICAKREDAKAKAAGTITNQRMEDDKRQQFAVIDRIMKQLQLDVRAVAKELMTKYPEDLLNECRKQKAQWKAYFEKYPL